MHAAAYGIELVAQDTMLLFFNELWGYGLLSYENWRL
uniref:Uncharacterized protein n=1 Tax=Arundo donax TaxID=35708 RepID=A0A0A9EGU1_ARUDO